MPACAVGVRGVMGVVGEMLPAGRSGVPSEAAREYGGGSWMALEEAVGRLGGGAALKKPRLPALPGVDELLAVGVAAY